MSNVDPLKPPVLIVEGDENYHPKEDMTTVETKVDKPQTKVEKAETKASK